VQALHFARRPHALLRLYSYSVHSQYLVHAMHTHCPRLLLQCTPCTHSALAIHTRDSGFTPALCALFICTRHAHALFRLHLCNAHVLCSFCTRHILLLFRLYYCSVHDLHFAHAMPRQCSGSSFDVHTLCTLRTPCTHAVLGLPLLFCIFNADSVHFPNTHCTLQANTPLQLCSCFSSTHVLRKLCAYSTHSLRTSCTCIIPALSSLRAPSVLILHGLGTCPAHTLPGLAHTLNLSCTFFTHTVTERTRAALVLFLLCELSMLTSHGLHTASTHCLNSTPALCMLRVHFARFVDVCSHPVGAHMHTYSAHILPPLLSTILAFYYTT
jgi:hypothetical protein